MQSFSRGWQFLQQAWSMALKDKDLLKSSIYSLTGTAYHTCLYIWAREVEKATVAGKITSQVAAPAPLAAVLGNI